MAKKRKKADVGQLTPAQVKVFEAQLALQQRAQEMAEAQVKREQETAARQAQFEAMGRMADMYRERAGAVGSQYDTYAGQVGSQREAALRQLAEAAEGGRGRIGSAQEQFLKDLVATRAYQDVPLLELGQVENPLLAGLRAEGASTAGVEAQSAQDAQIAAQLAALTRGSMGQLNVGEQNYLNALRNEAAQSAAGARTSLAGTEFQGRQGIQSEYDKLAQQIAAQRLGEVSDYEGRALEAAGQQQEFAPVEQGDYAAQLEAARKAALASIRRSLPMTSTGGGKTGTTDTSVTTPVAGTIGSSFGKVTVPYQNLPKGATLTPQQLKRKREAEEILALQQQRK